MSNLLTQTQLDSNLSLVLTVPLSLVGGELISWQNYCKNLIQPVVNQALKLEWFWINSELSTILVDDIRQQIVRLQYGVSDQSYRFAFILAADQASVQVQNTLLKILEEPPARTTLVLVTPNPASLIPTILSRCQIVPAKPDVVFETALTTELKADLETLTQLSLNPADFSYGQISLMASKYKAKTELKTLISAWLNQLTPQLHLAKASQIQLAKTSLKLFEWLDQNLNPVLALEHWLFEYKRQTQIV